MCKIVSSSNATRHNKGVMRQIMFQNNSEITKENILPLQIDNKVTNDNYNPITLCYIKGLI